MNYYLKYLKYKNKYFILKRQLGGTLDAKFKYEYDNSNNMFKSEMYDKIPDFINSTVVGNEETEVKKRNLRFVNSVSFKTDDGLDFLNALKLEVNSKELNLITNDRLKEILRMNEPERSKYIDYLTGFYSKVTEIPYPEGNFINKADLETTFTPEFRATPRYKKNITKNDGNFLGTYDNFFGTDNLYCLLNKLLAKKQTIEFIYLHAAGPDKLLQYYRSLGFTEVCNPFVGEPYNLIVKGIMFGNIRTIIETLRPMLKSNCEQLYT